MLNIFVRGYAPHHSSSILVPSKKIQLIVLTLLDSYPLVKCLKYIGNRATKFGGDQSRDSVENGVLLDDILAYDTFRSPSRVFGQT